MASAAHVGSKFVSAGLCVAAFLARAQRGAAGTVALAALGPDYIMSYGRGVLDWFPFAAAVVCFLFGDWLSSIRPVRLVRSVVVHLVLVFDLIFDFVLALVSSDGPTATRQSISPRASPMTVPSSSSPASFSPLPVTVGVPASSSGPVPSSSTASSSLPMAAATLSASCPPSYDYTHHLSHLQPPLQSFLDTLSPRESRFNPYSSYPAYAYSQYPSPLASRIPARDMSQAGPAEVKREPGLNVEVGQEDVNTPVGHRNINTGNTGNGRKRRATRPFPTVRPPPALRQPPTGTRRNTGDSGNDDNNNNNNNNNRGAKGTPAGPISFTPVTRRPSRAKKGKRVHACEVEGCDKVFTRAEHRRRHQLSHNPNAALQCPISSCGQHFKRNDLLARHLERAHNVQRSASFSVPAPGPPLSSPFIERARTAELMPPAPLAAALSPGSGTLTSSPLPIVTATTAEGVDVGVVPGGVVPGGGGAPTAGAAAATVSLINATDSAAATDAGTDTSAVAPPPQEQQPQHPHSRSLSLPTTVAGLVTPSPPGPGFPSYPSHSLPLSSSHPHPRPHAHHHHHHPLQPTISSTIASGTSSPYALEFEYGHRPAHSRSQHQLHQPQQQHHAPITPPTTTHHYSSSHSSASPILPPPPPSAQSAPYPTVHASPTPYPPEDTGVPITMSPPVPVSAVAMMNPQAATAFYAPLDGGAVAAEGGWPSAAAAAGGIHGLPGMPITVSPMPVPLSMMRSRGDEGVPEQVRGSGAGPSVGPGPELGQHPGQEPGLEHEQGQRPVHDHGDPHAQAQDQDMAYPMIYHPVLGYRYNSLWDMSGGQYWR